MPLWTSRGTWRAIGAPEIDPGLLRWARDGEPIDIGALRLRPYTVLHDAAEPLQLTIEDGLSRLLPRGQYVKFETAALLRGRTIERFQAYMTARQGGWMNVDEIRALEDRAPLPDDKGTDYLMPLNFAPVPEGGGMPDTQDDVTPPSTSDDEEV